MNDMNSVLKIQHLKRTFRQGEIVLDVLKDINFDLKQGEIVALVGPSGSGKSTLLQIAGLLERPSSGEVIIQNQNCGHMNDQSRTALRRQKVGYVYQFHHLLPEFSALENIALPQMINGVPLADAYGRAEILLKSLSLDTRSSHRPSKLSGGEQQRVAILRALANKPALLIADEPTGNLDEETAQQVFDELKNLVKESQMAALIATHNLELAGKMDRILTLHQGKLK
ncbi:MAG: ABC transporter ATP-binding protein [Janthinobacterium lividum]